MNSKTKFILIPFLALACTSSQEKSEELLQAADIHNEMIKSAGELEDWLDQLESNPSASVSIDSIQAWKAELEAWETEIVEVPGNEAHHLHEEGEAHDHSHHEEVQVTDQQMLTIQQDLRQRLSSLENRVKNYRN
jgi:hypothetical protein